MLDWVCCMNLFRILCSMKNDVIRKTHSNIKHCSQASSQNFCPSLNYLSCESLNSPGKWGGWGFSGSASGCWRSERSCCTMSGWPASNEPAKWVAKRWKFYALTAKTIQLGSHWQGMKRINYKTTNGNWRRDCVWRRSWCSTLPEKVCRLQSTK